MRDLCFFLFCFFLFSIVKYIRGPSCAHICCARHVIQTMNNTRFAQMTLMSRIFFFLSFFPLYFQLARHLDRAFGWAQSKSLTCMNLSAATQPAAITQTKWHLQMLAAGAMSAHNTNGSRQERPEKADTRICLASNECTNENVSKIVIE